MLNWGDDVRTQLNKINSKDTAVLRHFNVEMFHIVGLKSYFFLEGMNVLRIDRLERSESMNRQTDISLGLFFYGMC